MTITAVSAITLNVPYSMGGPKSTFFNKPRSHIHTLLVKVETSSGHVGWGEAFGTMLWPATRCVLDEFIAPFLIGREEDDIPGLMHQLEHGMHLFGRTGPARFSLSGLDLALWDIAGKKVQLPVSALLGGARRTSVQAYASLLAYGTPDLVARNCARAVEQGYRAVKVHETSLDCIRAAREAIGDDVALMVDANCAWTFEQAVDMLPALERLNLHWLEEPTWPPEDQSQLAALAKRTTIPLAAGENAATVFEIEAFASTEAVSVVQPSVTKIGGLTEIAKLYAGPAKQRVIAHSPYFGPGFLATLQLASTPIAEPMVERLFCDFEAHPLAAQIETVDGRLTIPSAPGLGADPDPELMTAFSACD